MKILKALVPTSRGKVERIDVIEYEGSLWLVPWWQDLPHTAETMPVRIILLDLLRHQRLSGKKADFLVKQKVPRHILDGHGPLSPEDAQFRVIEGPPIRFRGGQGLQ